MTDVRLNETSRHVYVCRYCGQPDPGEWGVGRRCPQHPQKDTLKPYMQACEFCPVPLRDLFTDDERAALVWYLDTGWQALDQGFSLPRDQNREVVNRLRAKLGLT